MKKLLKLVTSISFMLGLVFLLPSISNANERLVNDNDGKLKVSITDNQTGTTKVLDPKDIKVVPNKGETQAMAFSSSGKSSIEGYDVFIPIEGHKSTGVSPFIIGGGNTTSGGVTAKLYVDYDISTDNKKVRLNKVYGSWAPSSSMYLVSNRKVDAHTGYMIGKKISKTPTSNTFSYTTGWGYNERGFDILAPRAWSSATVKVSGMGGSHTIAVEFIYADK